MAEEERQLPYIPLIGGLYEGNPLDMATGYWEDGCNFRITPKKEVVRREGVSTAFRAEVGGSKNYTTTVGEWIANDSTYGSLKYLVVAVGTKFSFFLDGVKVAEKDLGGFEMHTFDLANNTQAEFVRVFESILVGSGYEGLNFMPVPPHPTGLEDYDIYLYKGFFYYIKDNKFVNPLTKKSYTLNELRDSPIHPLYLAYTKKSEGYAIIKLAKTGLFFSSPHGFASDIYPGGIEYSMASVKGNLVVTSNSTRPFMFTSDTKTISVEAIDIVVRDLEGVDDKLKVDEKPFSMSDNHYYNLRNQGWNDQQILEYHAEVGLYPANNQMWHMGKRVNPSTGAEEFKPEHLDTQDFGTTPAPKGRNKYTPFTTYDITKPAKLPTAPDDPEAEEPEVDKPVQVSYTNAVYDGTNLTLTLSPVAPPYAIGKTSDIILQGELTINYTFLIPEVNNQQVSTAFKIKGALKGTVTNANEVVISEGSPHLGMVNNQGRVFHMQTGWSATNTALTFYPSNTTGVWTPPSSGGGGEGGGESTQPDIGYPHGKEELNSFPSVVGSYAGRAWYSGVNIGMYGMSQRVFFSQVLNEGRKAGDCYQEADPTSEHISDLVDTDGGYVVIPEMQRCVALLQRGSSLLVIATNGVWEISGGQDKGFTATGYTVRKVSDIGTVSKDAVMEVEGQVILCNEKGIYSISEDRITGASTVNDISVGKVKERIKRKETLDKEEVKMAYDKDRGEVLFFYPDEVIVLNLSVGSYYIYKFGTEVRGGYYFRVDGEDGFYFYTKEDNEVVFLNYKEEREDFTDSCEPFSEPEEVEAYIDTVHNFFGDVQRDKVGRYLTMYFNITEREVKDDKILTPSSCLTSYSFIGKVGRNKEYQTYRPRSIITV